MEDLQGKFKDYHQRQIDLAVEYMAHSDDSKKKFEKYKDELNSLSENLYNDVEMKYNNVQLNYDVSSGKDFIKLHSHSFYEIVYCYGGSVSYLLDDGIYQMTKGDLIMILPGTAHQPLIYEEMEHPYERYALWINSTLWNTLLEKMKAINDLTDFLTSNKEYVFHLDEDTSYNVETKMASIISEYKAKQLGWEDKSLLKSIDILIDFARVIFSIVNVENEMQDKGLIDQIVSYINDNLSEKITMEGLSDKFFVSQSTISKKFQEQIHISPYQFIMQRRLIKAKQLILKDQPLKEVWKSCGFSDYSSFYRAFKKEYDMSPQNYKKLLFVE